MPRCRNDLSAAAHGLPWQEGKAEKAAHLFLNCGTSISTQRPGFLQ